MDCNPTKVNGKTLQSSQGFVGLAINPSTNCIYVNDMMENRLIVLHRNDDGSFKRLNDIFLPIVANKIHYDDQTGDIILGKATGYPSEHDSGLMLIKQPSGDNHNPIVEVLQADGDQPFHVASAIGVNGFYVLGSKHEPGPKI